MQAGIPRFFFSYSRADATKNPFLDRLFQDLRQRVADLFGLALTPRDDNAEARYNEVGFRDREGAQDAASWKNSIGAAIQHNAVLVCLYSPNFFSEAKQFCGREFTAFLRRHPERENAPEPGEIPGSTYVVPILWLGEKMLTDSQPRLPPSVLRQFSYDLKGSAVDEAREKLNRAYLEKGMRRIAMRRGPAYEDILNYFAVRIREAAKAPLPPLAALPDIEQLPNAWGARANGGDPAQPGAAAQPAPPASPPGSSVIRVIEVRPRGGAGEWAPFGDTIPTMVETIINRRAERPPLALQTTKIYPDQGFVEEAAGLLQRSIDASERPIVVVDPLAVAPEQQAARTALEELLKKPLRAGLLLPARAEDEAASRIVKDYGEQLKTKAEQSWLVRPVSGDRAAFETAGISVAVDLLSRIVLTDKVQQSAPENAGPTARPRISNQPESPV